MTMRPHRLLFAAITACCAVHTSFADERPPRAVDSRLKIELFAEQPGIVTPTGIDVDHAGRVWAIESNTHFPPEGYQGHPSDRILVMQDTDGDHRADKFTVFADGLKHTMSVAVKPVWLVGVEGLGFRVEGKGEESGGRGQESGGNRARRGAGVEGLGFRVEGQKKNSPAKPPDPQPSTLNPQPLHVFIATRRAIWMYTDVDGDLKADRKQRIIQLDTPGDYPHNGLAGFAFDAMGWMYFGFGENLGAGYKLIGSDGTTLKGGGEGGNVYRCRPDGSKLTRWATGFWNPHASCVDAFGRLFTVDNDPDSRPPCRLLHVIEGGDYGFRFRNGRKGLHPFTSWNGEIPGTLPMVSGTGEAPSGIVAYESDGFPEDYIGNLLVGSWGDHRIDRFRLKPRGASFESIPETIVQGGEDFRPVGLAVAPDGSLFLTDWVKRDYKLHGHGRVWRVSVKEEVERELVDVSAITGEHPAYESAKLLSHSRLEVRRTAATKLQATPAGRKQLAVSLGSDSDRKAIESLWALVRVPIEVENTGLHTILGGPTPAIQSNLVRSAYFELLASDPPQLPYSSELGQMLALLSGYSIADEELVKSFNEGRMQGHDLSSLMSALRVAAPWVSPRMLFEMDDEGEDAVKSERFAFSRLVEHSDPFLFEAFVDVMRRSPDVMPENTTRHIAKLNFPRSRLAYLLSARRRNPREQSPLRWGIKDPDPQIRRAAVQWIAEESLTGFRPQVKEILDSESMTTDLFLATLAALEMLDGKDPKDFDQTPAGKYVLPLVKDEARSPAVRAQALRLVDPNDAAIEAPLWRKLVGAEDAQLKREAVRSLQFRTGDDAEQLLRTIAAADAEEISLRADAVAGLGRANELDAETRGLLLSLLKGDDAVLRSEALRSLRGFVKSDDDVKREITALAKTEAGSRGALVEEIAVALEGKATGGLRPPLADEALAVLAGGNVDAGRRVFFHAQSAGCFKCHTVNGRGGRLGPDLSRVGGPPPFANKKGRKRLIESILEPSKEIAPQFTNWAFVMADGKVHTGILLGDTRDGKQTIGTTDGKTLELSTAEIEQRQPQNTSIMPDKLIERLTAGEFRDLLAYLESLK